MKEKQFGKFTSAEALLAAYAALEAEFTRRSQRLRALERILAENAAMASAAPKQEALTTESEACEKANETAHVASEAPQADKEDSLEQQKKAEGSEAFFARFPKARAFEREIADAISNGEEPMGAYISVLEVRSDPKELLDDADFLDQHVYASERIKQHVIAEYLNAVKSRAVPKTVSGEAGNFSVSAPIKPKTLEEAARLALLLLGKEG